MRVGPVLGETLLKLRSARHPDEQPQNLLANAPIKVLCRPRTGVTFSPVFRRLEDGSGWRAMVTADLFKKRPIHNS